MCPCRHPHSLPLITACKPSSTNCTADWQCCDGLGCRGPEGSKICSGEQGLAPRCSCIGVLLVLLSLRIKAAAHSVCQNPDSACGKTLNYAAAPWLRLACGKLLTDWPSACRSCFSVCKPESASCADVSECCEGFDCKGPAGNKKCSGE